MSVLEQRPPAVTAPAGGRDGDEGLIQRHDRGRSIAAFVRARPISARARTSRWPLPEQAQVERVRHGDEPRAARMEEVAHPSSRALQVERRQQEARVGRVTRAASKSTVPSNQPPWRMKSLTRFRCAFVVAVP